MRHVYHSSLKPFPTIVHYPQMRARIDGPVKQKWLPSETKRRDKERSPQKNLHLVQFGRTLQTADKWLLFYNCEIIVDLVHKH